MKLTLKLVLLVLCIGFAGTAFAATPDEMKVRMPAPTEVGKKAPCPVMNINFEVAKDTPVIDYKGKSYFFCCDHCVGDFKKDPEKYATTSPLVTRQATPAEVGKAVNCSVMNVKFDVAATTPVIDYRGKSYYFCCDHCVEEFKKDPDKFASK